MRFRLLVFTLLLLAAGLAAGHVQVDVPISHTLAQPQTGSPAPLPQCTGPIDPNTASVEALDKLPGVGPAIAQRIVEERERSGPFLFPEDLLCVPGIGPATLEHIREFLFLPSIQRGE